jgi:hypothetical protein
MQNRTGLILSLPLFFAVSHAAMAAATPEEATRLTGVFQSYLGAEPGVVTVTPSGDDYRVKFDIAPLAAKAAASGAAISLTPIELTLTDKTGGKWHVAQQGPLEFSVKSGDTLSVSMKVEDYTWEGVFDETLNTFESAKGEMKNTTFSESINDPTQGKLDVTATIKGAKIEQSATASSNGGADLTMKYNMDGLSETFSSAGNAATGAPPMNFVLTAESAVYDTTGKGLKAKPIFDLTAFFVSHPSKDLIVKDQVALKSLLATALPIFENVNSTGTFNKFSVTTPIGPVGIDSMTVVVDMNGVVKDGRLRESLSVTGLSIPAAIVPPWATTLVPKAMTFDFSGSGFDLAAPAQLILAALDFAKDPPLPAGFEAKLLPAFLPTGAATITLHPTSISNDIYSLRAEGSMIAGTAAVPSGQDTIIAKGLDEVMKAISAAPPEAGLQGGMAVIIAAKGMGKAEADGGLSWKIESTADGKVLVNGFDPTKLN